MYRNRTINTSSSILEAFKKMDILGKKLMIVFDKDKFYGLLSAGDIQRAIIQNIPLNTNVNQILRKDIRIASPEDSIESVKQMMFEYRMELCPVVNEKNDIVKVYFWEELFQDENLQPKEQFNLPIVIMAGGMGTRLRPLTNVLPKPLIPIGEKTILEHIFDTFHAHGCNNFYISVNYKADLIEYYLKEQKLPYLLSFFREEKPLGTAGGLALLKSKINETFFVSNCDILIEQDYSEILEYHRTNHNEITVVAALKHFPIAYGIIETGENGYLTGFVEKPELTFKISSGMYILEPHLLSEIPKDEFFNITDLINKVLSRNGIVGVFPVSEKSWKDIGEKNEYLNILKPKQK